MKTCDDPDFYHEIMEIQGQIERGTAQEIDKEIYNNFMEQFKNEKK